MIFLSNGRLDCLQMSDANTMREEVINVYTDVVPEDENDECAECKPYYGVFLMKPEDINAMIERPVTPVAFLFNKSF